MRGSRSWKRIRRHDDGWLEFSRVGQAGQQLPPTDQTGPGPYSGQECAFSWVRRELPKRDELVGWKAKTPPDSLHADHRDLQTARSCWRYRVQAESKALLSCKKAFHISNQDRISGDKWGMWGSTPPQTGSSHLLLFIGLFVLCLSVIATIRVDNQVEQLIVPHVRAEAQSIESVVTAFGRVHNIRHPHFYFISPFP